MSSAGVSYEDITLVCKEEITLSHTALCIFVADVYDLIRGRQNMSVCCLFRGEPAAILIDARQTKYKAHAGMSEAEFYHFASSNGVKAHCSARVKIAAALLIGVIYGAKKEGDEIFFMLCFYISVPCE
jgi:hypothetical protein